MKILVVSNFYPPDFVGGYELDDAKVPQMLYRVGGLHVRERVAALPKDTGIVRTFEFDGAAAGPVSLVFPDQPNVTIAADAGEETRLLASYHGADER